MKINESDIKNMVEKTVKKLNESKDYDILYRGNPSQDENFLWLTTSKLYASQYGKVETHKIPLTILDKLCYPDKKVMEYYIGEETDEYPLYNAEDFDVNKMISDGYTGYLYNEEEYKCVNVCLFKSILKKNNLL